MKILMIMLSGVLLVNNQKNIDKKQFEAITGTKVVVQGKVPVVAKKTTSKAKTTKKKTTKKATKKKVTKKAKKKVVKKKTKKKVYKQATRIRYNVDEIQSYAHQLVREYGWSENDYNALVLLWCGESGWNPNAVNKKSGACGLGQAYPCSKASKGTDYRTNWKTQVRWGLNYIKARYGTPSEAYRKWLNRKPHWY